MSSNISYDLVRLLQLLNFEIPSLKAGSELFKNPNKDLFRKIICFLLSDFGSEFEEIVKTYSKPVLPTKIEAQFKFCIKDAVLKINEIYPGYHLSNINQSQLISPQGPKIINFLISLSKVVVKLRTQRLSCSFVHNDSTVSICDEDIDHLEYDEEVLKEKISLAKQELELCIIQNKTSLENRSVRLRNIKLDAELKNSPTSSENVDNTLLEWKMRIIERLKRKQTEISDMQVLNNRVGDLLTHVRNIKSVHCVSVDGHAILNELGFKNNIIAQIDGVDILKDGKLKLFSLLDLVTKRISRIDDVIDPSLLKIVGDELDSLIKFIEEECDHFNVSKQELVVIIEKYSPIVDNLLSASKQDIYSSTNESDVKLKECLSFYDGNSYCNDEAQELPLSVLQEIPFDNITELILGSSENKSPIQNSLIKKNTSYRSTPLLGHKFSSHEVKNKNEKSKKSVIGLKPLLGLLGHDRRATVGSPTACRERFKIKHLDDRRKPLKPTTSKALLFSSSPLSESNAKIVSFGEESKVELLEDLPDASACVPLKDITLNSKMNLNKSLGTSVLENSFTSPTLHINNSMNLSDEVLLWDKMESSNLDISCCINNSDRSVNESVQTLTSDSSSSELNDSVKLLIGQFNCYKNKLNLND